MHTDELAGRSVLLVGATGGLGSALAADLAGRGAILTMTGRRVDALDALAVSGHRLALDLRDPRSCEDAVNAAVTHAGHLDVVLNAIGVVAFGPVHELSIDTIEDLFMTNTFVPIFLAKASFGVMREGGVFVNISGVIAEQNLPGMAAYGASKAAVKSFDEALAREARRRKIRVLDARPPHTETGLAGRALQGLAPTMATGLSPAAVARVIVDAIVNGATDLPSTAFAGLPTGPSA
jgi:cyclic-di-GMP-binding biofilm dispersal mediator protein